MIGQPRRAALSHECAHEVQVLTEDVLKGGAIYRRPRSRVALPWSAIRRWGWTAASARELDTNLIDCARKGPSPPQPAGR